MAQVLLIDDEPVYLGYLARKLERDGHVVRTATSSDEAREHFAEVRPDLVVVDWQLQEEQDGVALFASLRARAPALEGLLITGYPGEEVEQTLREVGLRGPLEKPFPLEALSAEVEAILAASLGNTRR